jgi:hypothetical protein
MFLGLTVTADVVAIEIATVAYLAVSSDREAATCYMLHNRIACHHLCVGTNNGNCQHRQGCTNNLENSHIYIIVT